MNPAFTTVLFVLSSLFRCLLLLLRRDFPFPSLTLDVPGSLVLHLASQLSSPVQKRVMRLVNAAIVLFFSWPRCLASHSSRTLCLKAAKASASKIVNYLVLFSKKHVPKLSGRLSGLLSYMTQIVRVRRSDISPLKICPKSIFEHFPASNGVFREDFKPVPSWPFEFQG